MGGEHPARTLQRMHNAMLRAVQKRQALRPRRGHVRQGERVQKGAVGAAATVCDQVSFQKPGLPSLHSVKVRTGICSVRESARLGGGDTIWLPQWPPQWPPQPIRCHRTELQQLLVGLVREAQVPVPFERRDQLR